MTQVFVLGAGTPTPTPDRWGSAFAVDVGGKYLMLDCGLAATAKLVKVGILPTRVDDLFFTHHHFDHDVELPVLSALSVGPERRQGQPAPRLWPDADRDDHRPP